jgi:hypothetical protein
MYKNGGVGRCDLAEINPQLHCIADSNAYCHLLHARLFQDLPGLAGRQGWKIYVWAGIGWQMGITQLLRMGQGA